MYLLSSQFLQRGPNERIPVSDKQQINNLSLIPEQFYSKQSLTQMEHVTSCAQRPYIVSDALFE